MDRIDKKYIAETVRMALAEDIGGGDITTEVSVKPDILAVGKIVAKETLVVAGIPVVEEVFRQVDSGIDLNISVDDGNVCAENSVILTVSGCADSILKGERTALNFLQRMSGIATLTGRFVKEVDGTHAVILDTRKTTPLLRRIEKYAVKMGGGTNHRMGLYDQFLFKDNHIVASIHDFSTDMNDLIKKAREFRSDVKVEVEVDTIDQFKQLIDAQPDIILLDNFSIPDLKEAVRINRGRVFLEASGGITLDSVRSVAQTGVDGISVGAITHSAGAVDIALDLELCLANS